MHTQLEINNLCIACDNCKSICPEDAVLVAKNKYSIDPWACTMCQACIHLCPTDAIATKKIKLEFEVILP